MALLRSALKRVVQNGAKLMVPRRNLNYVSLHGETPDEFNSRYECFFCRPDIDGWDIRQAMNDLAGQDVIPEPKIIIASLYACRRVNDYALTMRWLETIKRKCLGNEKTVWTYILQEIAPTLTELGVEPPECLGYDKPELYLECVDNIH